MNLDKTFARENLVAHLLSLTPVFTEPTGAENLSDTAPAWTPASRVNNVALDQLQSGPKNDEDDLVKSDFDVKKFSAERKKEIEELTAVWNTNKTDEVALRRLVEMHRGAFDFTRAHACIDEALALNPKLLCGLFLKGECYYLENKLENCYEVFSQFIKINKDDRIAWSYLIHVRSKLHMSEGWPDEIDIENFNDDLSLELIAEAEYFTGDIEKANILLKKAFEKNPSNGYNEIYHLLTCDKNTEISFARVVLLLNRYFRYPILREPLNKLLSRFDHNEVTKMLFETASPEYDFDCQFHYLKLSYLAGYGQNYNSEEVIQALDSLEEIIQDCQPLGSPEGPLMRQIRELRGDIYRQDESQEENFTAALVEYDMLKTRHPSCEKEVRSKLLECVWKQNKNNHEYRETVKNLLQDDIVDNPKHEHAHKLLGEIYFFEKNYAKASNHLRTAESINPKNGGYIFLFSSLSLLF